jgi:DNA primase
MSKKYVSKEDIVNGINILEFTKEFGIETESVSSGNFNYRCRCPSPDHKGGGERTGSLYIDSRNNNFYCFGCNIGSNCIDFYMLCTELSFGEAVSELKKRVKPGTIKSRYYAVETNNFYTLLQVSILFRKTMLAHKNDIRWLNDLMKYSDKFILKLDQKDDAGAKALLKKIQTTIDKRYNK